MTSGADSVEIFAIELAAEKEKGKLLMRWGKAVLSAEFTGQ
jgi:hypothetical protein